MEKYNNYFIDDIWEDNLFDETLNKISDLYFIRKNYEKRCLPKSNTNIDGIDIMFKESLEHYITKKLITEPDFYNSKQLKRYINHLVIPEIKFSLKNKLPLNNHFLNIVDDEILKKILKTRYLQKLKLIKEKNDKQKKEIINKIKKDEKITQKELNYICNCFAFNRDVNNKDHELLINYIINNLTKKDCPLIGNRFVSDAILAFLPKFYKTKDNKDLSNVRIFNTNKSSSNGTAYRDQFITINQNHYYTINFKTTDDINNINNCESNGFISYLQTAFHELSHCEQYKQEKNENFNDSGYMHIMDKILRKNLKDYKKNHDSYETEIDADYNSWLECKRFLAYFIKDETLKKQLTKQCIINSAGTYFRRATATKDLALPNNIRYTQINDLYDIVMLNNILEKHPEYIQEFPMLKTFYKDNGELDLSFLKNPKVKGSIIGKNYTKYAISKYPDKIQDIIINTKEQSTFSQIITTLYTASMNEARRAKDANFSKERKIEPKPKQREIENLSKIENFLKNRRINILDQTIDILKHPSILQRKTNKTSPIIYINKMSDKKNEILKENEQKKR